MKLVPGEAILEVTIRYDFSRKVNKGVVIKYRTEGGGVESFVKICGKISGPNILAHKKPIPQQKSEQKFHAPTKSTPVLPRE